MRTKPTHGPNDQVQRLEALTLPLTGVLGSTGTNDRASTSPRHHSILIRVPGGKMNVGTSRPSSSRSTAWTARPCRRSASSDAAEGLPRRLRQ